MPLTKNKDTRTITLYEKLAYFCFKLQKDAHVKSRQKKLEILSIWQGVLMWTYKEHISIQNFEVAPSSQSGLAQMEFMYIEGRNPLRSNQTKLFNNL
jgi:hypothetical protein